MFLMAPKMKIKLGILEIVSLCVITDFREYIPMLSFSSHSNTVFVPSALAKNCRQSPLEILISVTTANLVGILGICLQQRFRNCLWTWSPLVSYVKYKIVLFICAFIPVCFQHKASVHF